MYCDGPLQRLSALEGCAFLLVYFGGFGADLVFSRKVLFDKEGHLMSNSFCRGDAQSIHLFLPCTPTSYRIDQCCPFAHDATFVLEACACQVPPVQSLNVSGAPSGKRKFGTAPTSILSFPLSVLHPFIDVSDVFFFSPSTCELSPRSPASDPLHFSGSRRSSSPTDVSIARERMLELGHLSLLLIPLDHLLPVSRRTGGLPEAILYLP